MTRKGLLFAGTESLVSLSHQGEITKGEEDNMVKYLIAGVLWMLLTPALCQTVDYANTKARVTFQADTNTWLDGVGPGLGLTIYIRGENKS